MLHAPARGELGNRRGLAGPGGADHGGDAAGDASHVVDDRQVLDQQCQRDVRRIVQAGAPRRERRQGHCHIRRDIHRRQIFEHACL